MPSFPKKRAMRCKVLASDSHGFAPESDLFWRTRVENAFATLRFVRFVVADLKRYLVSFVFSYDSTWYVESGKFYRTLARQSLREVKRNISFRFKFISANALLRDIRKAIWFWFCVNAKSCHISRWIFAWKWRAKMRDEATECTLKLSLSLSTNCERLGSCIMDWHFADEPLIISLPCLSIPSRSRAFFCNARARILLASEFDGSKFNFGDLSTFYYAHTI